MSNATLYSPWRANYEIYRTISESSFEKVILARDKVTRSLVEIKSISINSLRGVPSTLIREIAVLKELEHDNIVRLLHVFVDPEVVNIVFEYVNFNLHKLIQLPGNRLAPPVLKNILHQILAGVAYCHSNKIIHRDLKPLNVLIDVNKSIVKIANFGFARSIEVPPNVLTYKIGTVSYRAPEILLGSTNYTEAVDMWAVGCIFAEMVLKRPLFNGVINEDVLLEIFKFFGVPSEETWPGVSSLRRDFSTAYEIARGDRRNLAEELRGQIEPAGFELLEMMLSMNPALRITADMAGSHPYFDSSLD